MLQGSSGRFSGSTASGNQVSGHVGGSSKISLSKVVVLVYPYLIRLSQASGKVMYMISLSICPKIDLYTCMDQHSRVLTFNFVIL